MKNIDSPEFQNFKINLTAIIDMEPEIFLPIFEKIYGQEITLTAAEEAELDQVLEEIKEPGNVHGPFNGAKEAIEFLHRNRE